MFDETFRPLSERKAMQEQYQTNILPLQDLCYATWTGKDGQQMIVDVLGTNSAESTALVSRIDEQTNQRTIWIAKRDQSGAPGTWLWTPEQLEEARHNPVRISDEENDFKDDETNDLPIIIGPAQRKRQITIDMPGMKQERSGQDVTEQFRAEDLDPEDYRERANPEPFMRTLPRLTQRPMKFSGGKKRRH